MLEKDAFDFLTGLYNRKGLYEKYNELPSDVARHLMFLDLDNFKAVNDVYGHHAGDKLLVNTGKLLKECAPDAEVVRLGGDEFVMLFCGDISRNEITKKAEKILKSVSRLNRQMQVYTMVSVSIGIIWNASGDVDVEHLLGQSDAAMYQAKQNGKNNYVFYNDLEAKFLMEEEMEELAEEALINEQFEVRYFPVMHMQSSRLVHSHVNVRWRKDENTIWGTEDFRPLFERNGFVRKLDLYIFERVCHDIMSLHEQGREGLVFSVRISRLLFVDESLGESLKEIMDKYGVRPDELELNIGETAFSARNVNKLIEAMSNLKKHGFSISIIDFGKDFSSFRYLRSINVDCVKFDKDYLKENLSTSRGRHIIKTLIKLGKELKLLVVAMGLTTKDDVTTISGYGCDAAGGSYYGDPLFFEDYIKYIEKYMSYSGANKAFMFKNNLNDLDGNICGEIIGEGIEFAPGISDNWGSIRFPGGKHGENVVSFPRTLFSTNSYTIALWLKPEEFNAWTSILYMRFMEGFASLVPSVGGGLGVFRIKEDNDATGWPDTFCRAVALDKWSFIAITYDAYTESVRYFIDGLKTGYRDDVPTLISCREVLLGGDPFQLSYKGYVSGLVVYDTVKTDEEIAELYNSFLREPGFCGDKIEVMNDDN